MQATATIGGRHEQQHHARSRAMVRFNGLMFYGVATASLLEAVVPLHASRLAQGLAGQPGFGPWLEQVWWSERAAHGCALRDYVAATWPEFDWDAAYSEFYEAYRPRYGRETWRRSAGIELLWCCMMEAQAAVFYRALARCADDPALRELAHCAGLDHVRYFDHFRHSFERRNRCERIGFGSTWRMLLQFSRTARDRDVALAFQSVNRHWSGQTGFVELGYGEFLSRMGMVISRHAGLGPVQRLLFRPWSKPLPGPVAPARHGSTAVPLNCVSIQGMRA